MSTYNYVQNNPISRIDPTGALDNTIFLDEEGNEIGRTIDDHDDAIVVVNNDDLSSFYQAYMAASLSPDGIGNSEVGGLRNFGDSYMIEGMNAVFDASMGVTLPPGSGGFVDSKGNPIKDLHPEASSHFNISTDGKTLTVDPDIIISSSTSAVGLGSTLPSIHSHPIHGGLYRPNPPGSPRQAREKEGPSFPDDYRNSAGRQRDAPSRYRDVVISPNNIFLYKGYEDAGKVPRSFFK